ncbi:MAG: NADAR family protein [Alphaproteobacteria bacterium]|nr:MAG: NADAR family protein [Alphaproteobacteria bacterium]
MTEIIPPIEIADDRPINFIETIWHYLSPFSAHQIDIWGESFATVEHAYHWARFNTGPERDAVKAAKSPLECLHLSHIFKKREGVLNPVFDKDAIMEELFRAKLTQHPHVAEILKLTGQRGLVKVIGVDPYWGTGPDGSGENRMGKLWLKLREELT